MPTEYIILIAGFIIGFYMAWNIGANDVANSMASAVGAKAITVRQAVMIASILNLTGAAFIGSHVADTIRKGIVSTEILNDPHVAFTGALAALLSAALWVSFATWKSMPISTTHAIVGAMVGFGLVAGGVDAIQWVKLTSVVLSWIISPAFSVIISFIMFNIIKRLIISRTDSFNRALKLSPLFIGLSIFIIVLSFLFKTPLGKQLSVGTATALLIALVFAAVIGFVARILLSRIDRKLASNDGEGVFRYIQVGTSCYVALAQGANDVANAVAPLAVIYFFVKTGTIGNQVPVPFFLLLFGGVGIALGVAMAGKRVMETLGTKITQLTNTRGFCVDFAAATTVLIASKLGLPVSTTHAAVGGVLGVGMARGMEALNLRLVYEIALYWLLTLPAAAGTCMVIYKILQFILHRI
ncbi:MAG: inorganic phosphate transporter [Desulfobacterales bacterium]|jgi:PiT family inorganic phosphate transporter|nr:inorganic phosphate transporter [Desulfobacterales bacterium]